MKWVVRGLADWIEDRTGITSLVKGFFLEHIPASAGWPQAFGSVALFLCLIQALTGILLSFNYAGTPGEAYNSLAFIIAEVPMGRMLHGLHHWGASLLLIVVVLHMIQVFLYGAYKKPREATWIGGVCILLTILGFSLTGYLLPWDNRAYWGTVVTTKIMGQAPLLGPYLQQIAGAADGIGVITFSRFYSLHVLLLPALTIGLLSIHLGLVRRHGVAPAPKEIKPKTAFYPEQVFKDMTACFIAFVLLFLATVFLRIPLERLADPTDASYVPRPEWYFLFLFELLKFFSGSLEALGSVGLPTVAVLALFCVPFLDRAKAVKLRQRTTAISIVVLALSGWTALTLAAMKSTPPSTAAFAPEVPLSADVASLSPEELAGVGYFRSEHCEACHNLAEGPPKPGPTLALVRTHRSAAWMIQHFKNPSQTIPGSNMPPILLPIQELNALSAFLLRLRPETAAGVSSISGDLIEGAQVYTLNSCGSCHKVNESGGDVGPKLNGLAARRSREWIVKHFENPQSVSQGTIMPAFHFQPGQQKAIVDFLLSLP